MISRWICVEYDLPKPNISVSARDSTGTIRKLAKTFDNEWYDPKTGEQICDFNVTHWKYQREDIPRETGRGNFMAGGQPFFVSVVDNERLVSMETVRWCFQAFDNPLKVEIHRYVTMEGDEVEGITSDDFIDACAVYSRTRGGTDEGRTAARLIGAFTRMAFGQ